MTETDDVFSSLLFLNNSPNAQLTVHYGIPRNQADDVHYGKLINHILIGQIIDLCVVYLILSILFLDWIMTASLFFVLCFDVQIKCS